MQIAQMIVCFVGDLAMVYVSKSVVFGVTSGAELKAGAQTQLLAQLKL